jgi:hypothetical protein
MVGLAAGRRAPGTHGSPTALRSPTAGTAATMALSSSGCRGGEHSAVQNRKRQPPGFRELQARPSERNHPRPVDRLTPLSRLEEPPSLGCEQLRRALPWRICCGFDRD